jgi:hypothetical protein
VGTEFSRNSSSADHYSYLLPVIHEIKESIVKVLGREEINIIETAVQIYTVIIKDSRGLKWLSLMNH